jgi:hypothetical protein
MPLILPGNVASATAEVYEVANSCRFNAADSAYMQWTPTDSAGTDGQIYTLSFWLKRGLLGSRAVFSYATPQSQIMFESTNFWNAHAFKAGGTTWYETKTNDLYRDPSAWYHFVTAVDTTQGTEANRVKVYVNGVQITSFADVGYPTEDQNTLFFTDIVHTIGRYEYGDSSYFDGYLAEFIGIDGTQYAASDFGEFDSDSPTIWKPKDPSELTFGDEGFWLDFEDSSALGNDVSGNDNDWTPSNLDATDQATDSPTNNFATYNPESTVSYKQGSGSYQVYSEGNTSVVESGGNYKNVPTTLASFSGKWYCELKFVGDVGGSLSYSTYGGVLTSRDIANIGDTYNHVGQTTQSVGYGAYDGETYISDTGTSYGDTLADGDILGIALDLDNSKVYFSKNSVWQNSGDPTSGATGTGAVSLPASDSSWHFGASPTNSTIEANFGGCPAFSISSAAADANGYGTFEYAPPSGYLALCTKNLGSDGG